MSGHGFFVPGSADMIPLNPATVDWKSKLVFQLACLSSSPNPCSPVRPSPALEPHTPRNIESSPSPSAVPFTLPIHKLQPSKSTPAGLRPPLRRDFFQCPTKSSPLHFRDPSHQVAEIHQCPYPTGSSFFKRQFPF